MATIFTPEDYGKVFTVYYRGGSSLTGEVVNQSLNKTYPYQIGFYSHTEDGRFDVDDHPHDLDILRKEHVVELQDSMHGKRYRVTFRDKRVEEHVVHYSEDSDPYYPFTVGDETYNSYGRAYESLVPDDIVAIEEINDLYLRFRGVEVSAIVVVEETDGDMVVRFAKPKPKIDLSMVRSGDTLVFKNGEKLVLSDGSIEYDSEDHTYQIHNIWYEVDGTPVLSDGGEPFGIMEVIRV